jgi:hypothetical protein
MLIGFFDFKDCAPMGLEARIYTAMTVSALAVGAAVLMGAILLYS